MHSDNRAQRKKAERGERFDRGEKSKVNICHLPGLKSGKALRHTRNWYICTKRFPMAKNTSILLGDYFDKFIHRQVKSGRFSSASEVIRAALRMMEQEEKQKKELIAALKAGENSGINDQFNPEDFMKMLHTKHLKNAISPK
ncbi:MAG: type II toxin-antitoxin system ParD family antitoxin [Flavobacteriales bacterium]|jgi:antitoxin ParD1/3/4